ncbi:FDD123 protein [Whalleya microplaca]|nr:FDD123 protein [Whalleya microplaca]
MSETGNQALNINNVVGMHANLEITNHGSDWYFTVCAVMGLSTLVLMALAFTKPQSHRVFHYITAGITAVACISYFAMGSNLGQVPIQAEFIRPLSKWVRAAGTREIFYARYIDWVITTPLLLLDLLLTAGVPTPTILATLLADEIMIVCGLVGALTRTSYKWGFWTFGMVALFFIAYALLFDGRKHAQALGDAPRKCFLLCGCWLILLWFLYPIAWGLGEGGNVIHPDSEAIFYGILDICAKPVFGFLLIFLHRNISPADIGMRIRQPGQNTEKYSYAPQQNNVHPEGPGHNVAATGHNPNAV